MEYIEYEVFASSIHGSDLLRFDTLDKAIEEATKWSMECIDCDVIINEVKTTKVKTFRNGGEVA